MIPFFGFGQEFSVSGQINDDQNKAISFVNVLVLTQQDSNIVYGTSTDDNGRFNIESLKKGNYIVKFSFIGYKEVIKTIELNSNLVLEAITLEEDIESLNEVSIIAKRPTLKKEADRLVFNIENTALTEGSMLQAIKSTPGVLVINNSITVKNSSPTVYINNRKVNLSSDELTQLLEGASASSIKSIEVITNPSAKYDAESGVVLSIVMSKNIVLGYRGNVFANYTQGVFPKYNVGTSHFFKNKKLSLNLNYNYTKSKENRDGDDVVNYLDGSNQIDQAWQSLTNRNTWTKTHNLNLNFDYFIDENNTLSFSSNALYIPYFKYKISNNTTIRNSDSDFLSRFTTDNLSNDDKYNFGFDLDFVHQFKKGLLSFNSHFTTYDYKRFQGVTSDFYDISSDYFASTAFNTKSNQDTKIFTSKVDYSFPINETSNFETGVKFSNIKTESDITQFDVDLGTGTETINVLNSDAFNYDEDVFSGYANYSSNTDAFSLSLGLRVEQTNIEGLSLSTNQINKQDYLEWFPNASVQHNISDAFNLYVNYKRSIARPSYTDLNPFRFFLNDNYVVVGNPNLRPTFLDHIVLGTTLFEKFTVEAYYQNYKGSISEIPRQNNNTNVIEYISVNFDKTAEYGFDFSTTFDISERWNIYFVTSFYNIEEETNFGNGFVTQDQWSNYSVLTNDITLLKDKSLNVYVDFTWLGKNLQGLQTVEDRLYSNLSISKSILKKKGTLSLTVSDLFNMQDFEVATRYANQFSSNNTDLDNRFIKLGFRYKFGNTKLETNERTKQLEERDRLEKNSN